MYRPDETGPKLMAMIYRTLAEAGFEPAHIELTYDGVDSEDNSYARGEHYFPVGHLHGHVLNLARALGTVGPRMEESNGLMVRFLDDGSVVVAPAHIGLTDEDEDEDEDGEDE